MEARLARIRTKEKAQRDKYMKGDKGFKRRKADVDKTDEGDEEQFVLEDYDSDQENGSKGAKSGGTFSAATLELMAKIGMGPIAAKEEEDETEDEIKVSGQKHPSSSPQLTWLDILLFKNTFSTHPIHQRAQTSQFSTRNQRCRFQRHRH